jgi:hypothetical protein
MNNQAEKRGRGRPLGVSPYIKVSLQELSEYFGPKFMIPIPRAWMKELGVDIGEQPAIIAPSPVEEEYEEEEESKIEFSITSF